MLYNMKKDLLNKIARKGYDIAYGANLNFATYDIVKKFPCIIAFLSIVSGILGLKISIFAHEYVSVIMLILGIACIYVERFTVDIDSYAKRGVINTDQLNQLKNLYYNVKGMDDGANFSEIEMKFSEIEQEFNKESNPNQILFSNWYAHFKLFCEKDITWMDEQLHFKLWKDKLPQTMKAAILVFVFIIIVYYCVKVPFLNDFFCRILFIGE